MRVDCPVPEAKSSGRLESPCGLSQLALPCSCCLALRAGLAAAASELALVMDVRGNEPGWYQRAGEPFVPASVPKIVPAWLAMEV